VGLSGLELLRGVLDGKFPAPPFAEVAELWPVSVEKGRIVFEATPSSRFYNPMGLVHGGWLALLLDTAMGCAVHSALDAGQAYATTDLRTTDVKPAREATGRLRCEARLLHLGGAPRRRRARSSTPRAPSWRTARRRARSSRWPKTARTSKIDRLPGRDIYRWHNESNCFKMKP
jgi:uncharacterized protein (TIGR00369 family)